MLENNFRIYLIFSVLIFLGLGGFGFAQESDSAIYRTSWSTPLLTKQEIIDGFDAGIDAGATHMLMVWDTWDFENSYEFIVYSYPGTEIMDLIKYYNAPGFYKVSAVLALDLDLDQQLDATRLYSERP